MGFLQPLALLGLAAVAVPPLLHLLGRRLPPLVVFPAVRYLEATEREHSRRLKLRNLLLMLLRMAVIALIVLAAARPVADLGTGGMHPPTAIAVVIDNSLSSGAVVGGRTVLDRLRGYARQLLADLAVGDELWIVTADGQPLRIGQSEASALVDTLAPVVVRLDVAAAARAASLVVDRSSLPAREVVVLSDLQATAFSAGATVPTRTLLSDAADIPANRGIDSAFAEPVLWSPDGVVVVGVSGAEMDAAAVRLMVGDDVLARAVATPGDRVALSGRLTEFGWHPGSLALDPDELRADDRWWLALRSALPAAVRARGGAGQFVLDAFEVLLNGGRVVTGGSVTFDDELGPGVTVLFPPSDAARVGAINRELAARGLRIAFGAFETGEWLVESELDAITGATVLRRYGVTGGAPPLATVGGISWAAREDDVIIVGSRMEDTWTTLPISAGFLPFLDFLANRVAASESWIVRAHPGDAVVVPVAATQVMTATGAVPVPADRRLRVPMDLGVHFLVNAAGDTVGALEVNHDPRESRLEPAGPSLVRRTLGENARVLSPDALIREAFSGARRAGLSGGLLLAALLAALAELALATVGSRSEPAA